jgi:ABC-2 type transport system ATP-binding protein
MSEHTSAIRFDRVSKHFGPTTALDDVSFCVPSGAVVGLLGANGAGKSTAIRILLGHARPDAGSATFFGRPLRNHEDAVRCVGAVTDSVGLDPALSGRRILDVLSRAVSVERSRVDAVLELTDATAFADRRVRELSTGMRQRIALAVALLADPACLVLDEPLTGLDPDGIRWLRRLLRELAAAGKAVLLSSHVLTEVEHTVDEVVVIRTRLLHAGRLDDLTAGASLEDRYFELVDRRRAEVLR